MRCTDFPMLSRKEEPPFGLKNAHISFCRNHLFQDANTFSRAEFEEK